MIIQIWTKNILGKFELKNKPHEWGLFLIVASDLDEFFNLAGFF